LVVVRVLVIDGDEMMRQGLLRLLELAHYEVYASPSFQEGHRLLKEGPFDLVLTDLFLPDRLPADRRLANRRLGSPVAFDLFAPLQALGRAAPGIPIVATTTAPDAAQLDPATVGVAAILRKPFDILALLRQIRQVLAASTGRPPSASAPPATLDAPAPADAGE
jgi:CheY-like chemotaxis protein